MVSKKSVLSASSIVVVGHMSSLCVQLLSNLILTRLLLPEAYGLVSIAMVIVFGLQMLSDVGLNVSVIKHNKELTLKFLNTAWTIQVIRNVILAFINLLIALGFYTATSSGLLVGETVYADPRLPQVLVATSIIILLKGFISINVFVNQRNMSMGRIVVSRFAAQLCVLPVTIYLAQNDYGVWSLIIAMILTEIINVLTSHFFLKGDRCWFGFDREVFLEIFKFGRWLLLASSVGFILSSGDRFFVAAVVSITELGVYSIAVIWIMAADQLISKTIMTVGLPVASALFREEVTQEGLKKYYKLRLYLDLLILTLGFLICFSSQVFIDFFYTPEYQLAGAFVGILSIGLFRNLGIMTGRILLSRGHSKIFTLATTINGLIFMTSVPISYFAWGLWAMIWTISINGLVSCFVMHYFTQKKIKLDWKMELRPVLLAIPALAIGYVCARVFEYVAVNLLGGDIETVITAVKQILGL